MNASQQIQIYIQAILSIPGLLEEQEEKHHYRLNVEEQQRFITLFLQQVTDYLGSRPRHVN
jgi:hypothetical protein